MNWLLVQHLLSMILTWTTWAGGSWSSGLSGCPWSKWANVQSQQFENVFSPQVHGGRGKPAYPKIAWCLRIQVDLELTLAELPGEITC